ncbi:MAG: sigma-70 family RNA polymerase sigma factor [Bacteroidales bacterium]|nr:sigma-70 family RNA polymerase sigma factor [Bacteroidales bacterium]MBN2698796.1 sigma-70 family RNA polymerase sigma factor [Bacteroidales bacterium]
MASNKDQYYIDRVKGGDKEAFTCLVDSYKDMVYTICLRMLNNHEDAEDAAQDVFLKTFRSVQLFQGKSKFATWLYRITYNYCISVIRSRVKVIDLVEEVPEREIDEDAVNALFDLTASDRERYVRTALEALAETDAVLITLFYYEDLSLKEIAEITGLTNNHVRVKLHRARQKLYEVLTTQLKLEIKSL